MAQFGDFTVDRNSTKYVLGSGGTIISYATDEPAFEFNADGSYKGLLVEPAATNICKQSEDFGTTWTTSSVLTTNAETAPDGNATADKLEGDGSSNSVGIDQSPITLSSGINTFSVFVKPDTENYIFLRFTNFTASTNNSAFYDLVSGTSPQSYANIEAYPNGWFRLSLTSTIDAGDTTGIVTIRATPDTTNSTYPTNADTNGKSVFLWGAQVETGPIATSYIPTTTASVTRNKDDITLGSASSLIGQTEGTLYVEVDWRLASGTGQYLLSVSDGTNNNRVFIYNTSGGQLRMYAETSDGSKTNQGVSSTAYSGIQKIAFAYANNDFELYRNGSSISTDTNGSLAALATMTDIDLGQEFNANSQANMHIRAVALYPTRLSDAECEALTTL